MKILLVTSWNTPNHCGIEAHSRSLIGAVRQADPSIELAPSAEALDPKIVLADYLRPLGAPPLPGLRPYVVHLNYHAGLHSRWTPDHVRQVQARGVPVVITYHDTGVPNSDQCLGLYAVADRFIIHEPCADLPTAIYWRQGVPDTYVGAHWHSQWSAEAPIIGTVGHDFPWKNFDLLCELAEEAGWGVVICTPAMSAERIAQLKAKCRRLSVRVDLDDDMVLASLRGCDATAFLYTCANTGTSAAIRQGVAAGKPLIAFHTCRQFRDLYEDDLGRAVIKWAETVEQARILLRTLQLQRFDTGIVALAARDSWVHAGQQYADLYRGLCGEATT